MKLPVLSFAILSQPQRAMCVRPDITTGLLLLGMASSPGGCQLKASLLPDPFQLQVAGCRYVLWLKKLSQDNISPLSGALKAAGTTPVFFSDEGLAELSLPP